MKPGRAPARPGKRGRKGKNGQGGGAGRWLSGLVGAAALAAAAGGLLGYLGDRHWTLEVLAHFRLQYATLLPACALAFLALGRLPLAGLAAAAAVAAGAPLVAHRLVQDVRCPAAAPGLTVLSLHLPAPGEGSGVRDAIRGAGADVVFLMGVDPGWVEALEAGLGDEYPHRLWEPRADAYGVGLLSRLPPLEAGVVFLATSLPSMVATLGSDDGSWTVVGTHAQPPTGGEEAARRNLQLEALAARVRGTLEPTVVMGTLSTTPWAASFAELLGSTGLQDGGQGDWPSGGWGGPLGVLRVPVDHALVSEELCVVERSAGPDIGSRHLPLRVEVARR
jgi:endonuclease/exonuclease/phosphatase (EEP) superfamily protein YafD